MWTSTAESGRKWRRKGGGGGRRREEWGIGRYGKLLSGGWSAHENPAEEPVVFARTHQFRMKPEDSSFHTVTKSASPWKVSTWHLSPVGLDIPAFYAFYGPVDSVPRTATDIPIPRHEYRQMIRQWLFLTEDPRYSATNSGSITRPAFFLLAILFSFFSSFL